MSDKQFLTSPFLPRFHHLFSHKLNFLGGPPGPLRTPGPRGTCPGYPPLSVGLGGPPTQLDYLCVSWANTLTSTSQRGWSYFLRQRKRTNAATLFDAVCNELGESLAVCLTDSHVHRYNVPTSGSPRLTTVADNTA